MIGSQKIAIIGATSRTASELLPLANAAGLDVTAFAKNPERISFQQTTSKRVRGDAHDPKSLVKVLEGDEVVISLVGQRFTADKNVSGVYEEFVEDFDCYSRAAESIVSAMRDCGNQRLLFTTSGGINFPRPTTNPATGASDLEDNDLRKSMYFWNLRKVYEDMERAEAIIRNSALEYTILRPTKLLHLPSTGDYRTTAGLEYPTFSTINYADFAAFILAEAKTRKFINRSVAIYSDNLLAGPVT